MSRTHSPPHASRHLRLIRDRTIESIRIIRRPIAQGAVALHIPEDFIILPVNQERTGPFIRGSEIREPELTLRRGILYAAEEGLGV